MKRAYGITHNIYNKKCMSIHTKIRHYNTVIKPQALYASETLTILTKSDMENILKEERKIIRKILGPKRTEGGYRLHSRKTTQQMSNIAADIRKRRLKFYGHISRLPPTRIANRILKYIKGVKSTTPWITQVEIDLQKARIDQTDVQDRNTYRNKIHQWNVMPENEVLKKPGTRWTEERKKIHREKMREVWKNRKNTTR
ncbi:hypothetical protein WA026_022084 [Henosepilachna vigintioctopunctata]|uniref:Endonuclease-reverse transcriptase n=1 Tax=Henosepilachna vigintioctopunctata TaxID=420089 RepID=A0AAW1UBF9_9CUCU